MKFPFICSAFCTFTFSQGRSIILLMTRVGRGSIANTLAYAQPSSPLPYKHKILQEKSFILPCQGKVSRKKNSRRKKIGDPLNSKIQWFALLYQLSIEHLFGWLSALVSISLRKQKTPWTIYFPAKITF